LNSDEPVSLTFTEDTLTIDSPLRDQLTVFQYELANCRYYNGSPTPCFQLYSNGQESFTIPYTIHGYCMSFWLSTSQSSTACKSDSDNESTIIVSNYLYLYTGIILVVLGLLPILLLVFRSRIFRRRKRLIDSPKIRVSIPSATRQQVYARARGRCERPRCSYHGKLHIHHIDENPSNNSPTNLVAVCPNCHTRIHDGEFSIDAQRSWIAS
jgi:hypothetical protein